MLHTHLGLIPGIEEFTAMTERLTKRIKDLTLSIVKSVTDEITIVIEWEITLSFKNIRVQYYMD